MDAILSTWILQGYVVGEPIAILSQLILVYNNPMIIFIKETQVICPLLLGGGTGSPTGSQDVKTRLFLSILRHLLFVPPLVVRTVCSRRSASGHLQAKRRRRKGSVGWSRSNDPGRKGPLGVITIDGAADPFDHNKLWKILKELGILDHLTCLLRNLYAGQEATVKTGHGITDWFQIGKGVHQGCILSPCLFNLYAEYIMRNAVLDEAQTGIKIAGRNINNLRYADDTTLMAESKEEQSSLLMKVQEESEKAGLKLNIQKTKIMASHPITSWQIDGETVETVTDFILGVPKSLQMVTEAMKLKDGCSWHLDSILKSRDITLPTKVCLVKAMVFSVGIYGCESWTIKKTEC